MSGAKANLEEFRHHVNFNESLPWKKPLAMSFTLEDAKHIAYPHDDPLVVTLKIYKHPISINICKTYDWPGVSKPVRYLIIGFAGSLVVPEGLIFLPVRIGENEAARDVMVEFLVVDVPGAYNAIIG